MVALTVMLAACSATKHVPQGSYLLNDVSLRILDKDHSNGDVNTYDLVNYLRQTENHEVLGGLKLQLAMYNLLVSAIDSWLTLAAVKVES